jgi:hypothetical protein
MLVFRGVVDLFVVLGWRLNLARGFSMLLAHLVIKWLPERLGGIGMLTFLVTFPLIPWLVVRPRSLLLGVGFAFLSADGVRG